MSIEIKNFSIEVDNFLDCTLPIEFGVDIVDTIYSITTSGTYFTNNGEIVPIEFQAIQDGYRISYSTIPSGNMILTANASNSNG